MGFSDHTATALRFRRESRTSVLLLASAADRVDVGGLPGPSAFVIRVLKHLPELRFTIADFAQSRTTG